MAQPAHQIDPSRGSLLSLVDMNRQPRLASDQQICHPTRCKLYCHEMPVSWPMKFHSQCACTFTSYDLARPHTIYRVLSYMFCLPNPARSIE